MENTLAYFSGAPVKKMFFKKHCELGPVFYNFLRYKLRQYRYSSFYSCKYSSDFDRLVANVNYGETGFITLGPEIIFLLQKQDSIL